MGADLSAWEAAGKEGPKPPDRPSLPRDEQSGTFTGDYRGPYIPRPGHTQPADVPQSFNTGFAGCQFPARYLDLKENNRGDLILQFKVASRHAHLAADMRGRQGVPLSVDVQMWLPYQIARGLEEAG